MTAPLQRDTPTSNTRRRRGPRNADALAYPGDRSESLRLFMAETDGLTGRLPLANIHGMRKGTVNNPYTLTRRYLVAMRSAALPKEKALRFANWVRCQAEMLWPMEGTAVSELERRAMHHEGIDNLAELAHHTQRSRETLQSRRDTLACEIAADQLLLAKLDRELEDMA